MYQSLGNQLTFDQFELSFGGKLQKENRWVKLANAIPWTELEGRYAEQMSEKMGRPAFQFRVAFGALIIKAKLSITDQETVEQIFENPYLQYFLGFTSLLEKKPFDSSEMVNFRDRINECGIGEISDKIVGDLFPVGHAKTNSDKSKTDDGASGDHGSKASDSNSPSNNDVDPVEKSAQSVNHGSLIVDATVAPADVRYPTDVSLVNEAREKAEEILDELVKTEKAKRPRTYRFLARWKFSGFIKRKHPGVKDIRKARKIQLQYLRRILAAITTIVAEKSWRASLKNLRYLWIIQEIYRQQLQMQETGERRIDDRIVSIRQPHVRPIIRGKAGRPVEFGAKISLSAVVDGCCRIDRFSWDAYNESCDLKSQVEGFKERYGHYPAVIFGDQIYGSRENRAYLAGNDIRYGGIPLGRVDDEKKKLIRNDVGIRNEIEGRFGIAKRRYGLGRILEYEKNKSQLAVYMVFLVMNLDSWLRKAAIFLSSLVFWAAEGVATMFLIQKPISLTAQK